MAKIRVYELALEFGITSRAVLENLKDMNEFLRSASSPVEPAVERRLRERHEQGTLIKPERFPAVRVAAPRQIGDPLPPRGKTADPDSAAARAVVMPAVVESAKASIEVEPKPKTDAKVEAQGMAARHTATDGELTKIDRQALLERLHPRIRESAGRLWIDAHYNASISAACLIVMTAIRERGDSDLDGQPLITEVLRRGGKKPTVNGQVDKRSASPEQVGIADLASGLWRAYRNPLAHRDVGPVDGMEAFEVLILASLLIRQIQRHSTKPAS